MPIVAADLAARLSGGTANTTPSLSIGGAMSTVSGGVITTAVLNNLWDDVTGDEAAAGRIEFRCLYVHNNHATLSWQTVKIWISSLTTSTSTEMDIALDPAAVGSNSSITLADEADAASLSSLTFSRPTTKATGLSVGDIPAGSKKAFWMRRTVSAGAGALAIDAATFRAEGDTA